MAFVVNLLSTSELLRQKLPSLNWGHTGMPSAAGGNAYYVPATVEVLEVDNLTGAPWKDSVMQMQHNPDADDPWAVPLADSLSTTVISEAGIAVTFGGALLVLLHQALNKASAAQQLPQSHGWVPETTTSVLQKAVSRLDPRKESCSLSDLTAQNAASSNCGHRHDVVLIVDGQQQQRQEAPGVDSEPKLWFGEPVAIGQFNKPTILGSWRGGNQFDPHNLRNGFKKRDAFVLHAVGQVYTYLLLLELQYGFISCYYWTWVVYLGKDRRTLYLSEPIPHDRKDTSEQPAVTAMGAIYWVQRCGLATRHVKDFDDIEWDKLKTVRDLKDELQVVPESQQTASQPTDDDRESDYDPKRGDSNSRGGRGSGRSGRGSGRGSGGNKRRSGSKGSGVNKQTKKLKQSAAAFDSRSQLGRLICEGCSGLVMRGIYQGQPAVYKLFGPDREGIVAGINEGTTYGALLQCQGDAVPTFLDWGHLAAGIYYLATAYVDGVPCSELTSELQAAATAAETALQHICAIQPGFVHGDLRLANIMVKHDSDDTAALTAVFIDLAASRLDGSQAEVKAQFQQLKYLFRRK